jgi:hypothetical protein
MSSTARQNNLLLTEDWKKIYQSFRNADFQSYDFENLRRVMIDYLRTNFPEDFNDYIESSEYLALIDLIAYVGQSIAFRVDLNARENFLELAERRDSILRLARLISYNAKRNIAASGLLKFNAVQTTESVIDSNGRNVSGQYITWNDPSNANWYDQFIKVINAALPANQQFGSPIDQATIYGIPTSQYRFNATNTDVPIYGFTKSIAGRSMDFEIASTTFHGQQYIYEEAPKIGNQIACVYTDDGYGAASPGTGFFFRMTQGTMNQGTFTFTNPNKNETIDVADQSINNTDVWLYNLDQNGLEFTLWTQVPAITGNNVIYNSLSGGIKNIYNVITRASDAITLGFSDGTFGNLPLGNFRLYYRVSNNLTYTINASDISNVLITIPYQSVQGTDETLTISLSLATSITNATTSETNTSVKTNAPQTYYTQNRMITGEDYNISPLSANQQVAKVKAVNRSSSGISRYFDLIDPTGKYSSTNIFSDDGVIYKQDLVTTTTFSYTTKTDIQGVIYNTVFDILSDPSLRNFYYANYISAIPAATTGENRWNSVTLDSNASSGYIMNNSSQPTPVGGSASSQFLQSITAGALLRFDAPTGYYFNTLANNKIVQGTTIPLGGVTYLWAEVVSVYGDGTASGTGILSTGYGAITLNKAIPSNVSGPVLTHVIPKFSTVISSSVITTMIDLIYENNPFGLRYDQATQSWQIIFESNLNVTSDFSVGFTGDTTSNRLDASWFLLFTTNNEYYTLTTRSMRYVFESDVNVTFYFDSAVKIYDSITSSLVTDGINVLSVNTQPAPNDTTPFTSDIKWDIVSGYIGQDGYVDPKKVVISFADTDANGVVDNPQAFVDLVYNSNTGQPNYIVQKRYTIAQGQEDYKYVANNPASGPVIIVDTEAQISVTSDSIGKYYYITSTKVVKVIDSSGNKVPSLDYKVYEGRDVLKFQYTHSADYDSRIDPGSSNIMDMYVLTTGYDTAFRQWLAGANTTEPMPPSQDELSNLLGPSLNLIKSISDEVIYHPVNYKLLFGPGADPSLQATFNVVKNPNSSVSNADITARILVSIEQFFALSNWDFGDTFYFTELSTYVMNQLAPDITNFVIVPSQSGQYFGSLFEIKCPSNQIFLSSATANEINIVSGYTSSNLKTVTGNALGAVATTQQITSANYGATN